MNKEFTNEELIEIIEISIKVLGLGAWRSRRLLSQEI